MTDQKLASVLEWLWEAPVPPAVEEKARLVILDTLGCAAAAAREPRARAFAAALASSDPGAVAVPGFEGRFSAGGAAALLAAGACWHEACEGLARAHGRPGVPVIAAILALAQVRGASLGDAVAAVISGDETGGRIGEALRIAPGMHVDGTWPAFGVAAAAVRIGGGSAAQALAAVQTVACQLPYSLYLAVKAGAQIRGTYLGHAAQLGMLAASAALAGLTAPEGGLDAQAGLLFKAGSPKKEIPTLAAPGQWLLEESYLKPFAAVRHVQYGAAAALALREQVADRLERITRIDLSTYAEAITYCGNRAPRLPVQAQFSLSYGVACALATGELVPESYSPDVMEDSLVKAIEERIVLTEDAALTAANRRGATLSVFVEDDCVAAKIDKVAGDPAQPMTRAEAVAKFARYSGRPAAAAEAFLDAPAAQPLRNALEKLYSA